MRLVVPASGVLAQVQADVLGRSLLIAAVLVSPYAVYKWRQVARVRAETAAALAPEPDDDVDERPRLEDLIESIGLLDLRAESAPTTIRVPHGLTVDGREAPPAVVDALVRDALRRSGLIATAEVETADARVIELTAAGPAGPDAPR